MDYAFQRSKIPRTLAFPLKRTTLDAALEAAGVTDLVAVTFTTHQRGDAVLRVEFTGEHKKGWAGAGRASLVLYAVPARERRVAEEALVHGALPQACSWLRRAQDAGTAWREADHFFEVHYSANGIEMRES
jgi:hypothetical protein